MTRDDTRAMAWIPHSIPAGRRRLVERHGAVLFADISGFTALTEFLSKTEGNRGIEILTEKLNCIFGQMIDIVTESGGEILKFGGDAILVGYNGDDALGRATWCADRLHRIVKKGSTRTKRGRLSLHVGVAEGSWHERIAGSPGVRREHYVYGDAIAHAMMCADDAGNGTTKLRLCCRKPPMLPPARLEPIGPSCYRVVMPRCPWVLEGVGQDDRVPAGDIGDPWDFVPLPLRPQLRDPGFDPMTAGEHRRVSTLFLFWRNRSKISRDQDGRFWDALFSVVHETVESCGGLWARSDPGDKYQKVLLLFGAPTTAVDDVDRALECASRLRLKLGELQKSFPGLRFGMGLTTQPVYSGYVGNRRRHEFTAMGDGVNLAARLAARCKTDAILVDPATRRAARNWQFAAGPKLTLKGLSEPVPTFRPLQRHDAHAVRRDDDILEHPAALDAAHTAWCANDERALIVRAMPVADNYRFVRQLIPALQIDPKYLRRVSFEQSDRDHPHAGLHRVLNAISIDQLEGLQTATLSAIGGEANADVWQAVLGDEKRLARMLADGGVDLWVRRVADAVTRLPLFSKHADVPVVLLLEQAQNLSPIDKQTVGLLTRTSAPGVRLIVHEEVAEFPEAPPEPNEIRLGAVKKAELRRALGALLPSEAISGRLLDFLFRKSNGMIRLARLYLGELLQSGVLAPTNRKGGAWQLADLSHVELPDTLRAHFLQRLDRLPSSSAQVLRILAVLGDGQSLDAIRALSGDVRISATLDDIADSLLESGLIRCERTAQEIRYSFADPMCRLAAYETMSFGFREELHGLAARYLSRNSHAADESIGEHFFLGHQPQKALAPLLRAGDRARKLWLLERAQRLYRWALMASLGRCQPGCTKVVPSLPRTSAPQSESIIARLADVLCQAGIYKDATPLHRRLAAWAVNRGDWKAAGEQHLAAARLEWLAGRYQQAERGTRETLKIARRIDSRELVGHAHLLLGEIMRRTGRLPEAEDHLAKAAGGLNSGRDKSAIADVANTRGIVAWNRGRLAEASSFFRSALRHLKSKKDAPRRGQIANNLGILLEEAGRLHQAAIYYRQAFDTFDRIGHRRNRAYCLGNLANLYRCGARYEHARAAYEETEFELRTIGEQHAAAYTWGNLGDLFRDFGQWARAEECFQKTLAFARRVKDWELIAECYARLAEVRLHETNERSAQQLLQLADHAAKRANSVEFPLRVALLRAGINRNRGHLNAAASAYQRIESEADSAGFLYYRLWAQVGRARIAVEQGNYASARRQIRSGLTRSARAGYRWWEMHFAVLGARTARLAGAHDPAGSHENTMQVRAESLQADLESAIGDPKILRTFRSLELFTECQKTYSKPAPTTQY